MTKKFLLSAGAVAVLAFAGAATAGDLTSGAISGVPVNGAYEDTNATVYNLASERTFDEALSTDDQNCGIGFAPCGNKLTFGNLTNVISVPANTSGLTFIVTYNLSGAGDAKFANVSMATIKLGSLVGSVTPILSNGGKTLTAYVTLSNDAENAAVLNSVEMTKFDLSVAAKGDVSVAYSLKQVIAGQNVELDSASATQIIGTKSVFDKYFAVNAGSVYAKLPDFNTFNQETGSGVAVGSGGAWVTSSSLQTTLVPNVYTDLMGTSTSSLSVGDIIESAEVTLTGAQVEALNASLGCAELPEDATATSAVYELDGGALNTALTLTPGEDVRMTGGQYKVSIKPTFVDGWSGVNSADRTLIVVNLEGTNFYAPWFGFGGAASNATLRIGNNSENDTGPIVIELKANNGTNTTNTTATFPGVAAGRFMSITGAQLRSAFGTDAANGDLLVSIQSDAYGDNISAKVRTVQPNGNTFESSLDVLRPVAIDPTQLQNSLATIGAGVASVQATADTIDGAVAQINTTVGGINTTVNATSTAVNALSGQVTDITSAVSGVAAQVNTINGKVDVIDGNVTGVQNSITGPGGVNERLVNIEQAINNNPQP